MAERRATVARRSVPRPVAGGGRARDEKIRLAEIPADAITAKDAAVRDAIVRMAVDAWRFSRTYERAVSMLSAGERFRFEGPLAAFGKKIEEALRVLDMRIVNIEGTPFDPGIAAIPVNIEDFAPDDDLRVDKMTEPIIMGRGGIVKMGSVTLRKAGE